jgi:hypothetical protein
VTAASTGKTDRSWCNCPSLETERAYDGLFRRPRQVGGCSSAAAFAGSSATCQASHGPDLGDAVFDAILEEESGVVFSIDDWKETWKRVETPDGRLQLAQPERFEELDGLASD